jgi:hypothetical protein
MSPRLVSGPPMTMVSGLIMLATWARARPMAAPASSMTRRAAVSPARAQSTMRCVSTVSVLPRPRSSIIVEVEATVSRQPRLPHRQITPCSLMVVWPTSPVTPTLP